MEQKICFMFAMGNVNLNLLLVMGHVLRVLWNVMTVTHMNVKVKNTVIFAMENVKLKITLVMVDVMRILYIVTIRISASEKNRNVTTTTSAPLDMTYFLTIFWITN